MKRLKLLLALILSLSLTGCIQKYEVTEEESNAIAEYMAGMLLKYNYSYKESLLPKEEVAKDSASNFDTTASDTVEVVDKSEVKENEDKVEEKVSKDQTSLSKVIGVSGFSIEYTSYKLVDSYPEDPVNEGFYLAHNDGYQYLVASFKVKNTSDSKKEINLIKSDIDYQLKVNGSTKYEPALTLLDNDLKYLDEVIGAGKSRDVVLVFKISSKIEIKDITLTATKENKTVTIAIR